MQVCDLGEQLAGRLLLAKDRQAKQASLGSMVGDAAKFVASNPLAGAGLGAGLGSLGAGLLTTDSEDPEESKRRRRGNILRGGLAGAAVGGGAPLVYNAWASGPKPQSPQVAQQLSDARQKLELLRTFHPNAYTERLRTDPGAATLMGETAAEVANKGAPTGWGTTLFGDTVNVPGKDPVNVSGLLSPVTNPLSTPLQTMATVPLAARLGLDGVSRAMSTLPGGGMHSSRWTSMNVPQTQAGIDAVLAARNAGDKAQSWWRGGPSNNVKALANSFDDNAIEALQAARNDPAKLKDWLRHAQSGRTKPLTTLTGTLRSAPFSHETVRQLTQAGGPLSLSEYVASKLKPGSWGHRLASQAQKLHPTSPAARKMVGRGLGILPFLASGAETMSGLSRLRKSLQEP